MDRPEVLRLITRLNIGGPARQALMLTRELSRDFPTLLAAGQPPAHEGEMSDPGVSVAKIPLKRRMDPVSDARALRMARSMLRGKSIVHTHTAKAGTIGRLAVLTSSERPRTVHTFHGHVLEGYFPAPIERSFIAIEKWLAKRTDVLVAVSEEVRDSLVDLGIGDDRKIRVIPLGFDLTTLLSGAAPRGALRRRIGVSSDVPLVGVLGRLAPIKDHMTLIRAVARLDGVHLAILGDGETRPDCERLISDLKVSRRVHLVGWWSDVATAVTDMDVVALSSRNEGTPVSLIEASAAGKPVVATDVGGTRSVVVDGRTGFLVGSEEAEALSQKIDLILGDSDLGRKLGEAGREHVRERFSHERLIADIRSLYEELCSQRAGRG